MIISEKLRILEAPDGGTMTENTRKIIFATGFAGMRRRPNNP